VPSGQVEASRRIARNTVVFDALGLLTQLGVVPAPEPVIT
jgi:hypothetical protein